MLSQGKPFSLFILKTITFLPLACFQCRKGSNSSGIDFVLHTPKHSIHHCLFGSKVCEGNGGNSMQNKQTTTTKRTEQNKQANKQKYLTKKMVFLVN